MNKMIMLGTAAAFGLATAGTLAQAGNLEEPIVEAPVIVPVAPVYTGGDWGGFYGGLSLGYADVSADTGTATLEDGGVTYGIHGGYNYDFGKFVLGTELEYSKTDIDLGAATVDSVARLKLRGGYDLGNSLIYATAGVARADTSLGNDNGKFIGIGMDYKVTDRFTVGGELLEHRFDDIGGSGVDADATTFSLRGSFNF